CHLFSMCWAQYHMTLGFSSTLSIVKRVAVKVFPPNASVVSNVWGPLSQTIQLAVIATTVAAVLTVPLALLSARNITTSKSLYLSVRTFMNILRTIPDLGYTVVFVGLIGV